MPKLRLKDFDDEKLGDITISYSGDISAPVRHHGRYG